MPSSSHHTIVVGIDGGPASSAALEVALIEAELRGARVRAIVCWPGRARADQSAAVPCDTQERATALLAHTVEEALRRRPSPVTVTREVNQSLPGSTLVAASAAADLMVLGSTTRGSTARHHGHHIIDHCLRFTACPVVIVPWSISDQEEAPVEAELESAPS